MQVLFTDINAYEVSYNITFSLIKDVMNNILSCNINVRNCLEWINHWLTTSRGSVAINKDYSKCYAKPFLYLFLLGISHTYFDLLSFSCQENVFKKLQHLIVSVILSNI